MERAVAHRRNVCARIWAFARPVLRRWLDCKAANPRIYSGLFPVPSPKSPQFPVPRSHVPISKMAVCAPARFGSIPAAVSGHFLAPVPSSQPQILPIPSSQPQISPVPSSQIRGSAALVQKHGAVWEQHGAVSEQHGARLGGTVP